MKLVGVVCDEGGPLGDIPNAKYLGGAYVSIFTAFTSLCMWSFVYYYLQNGPTTEVYDFNCFVFVLSVNPAIERKLRSIHERTKLRRKRNRQLTRHPPILT